MTGRWPANVILSPQVAEVLDHQSGTSKSNVRPPTGTDSGIFRLHGFSTLEELRGAAERGEKCPDGRDAKATLARAESSRDVQRGHADEGGASRFFLNAGYEAWELDWIYANGLRPCE